MEVSGTYTVYAPRERVWEALLDPELLRRTVPGCERLERESEDHYRVRVNVNVAGVKGIYDGTLRVSDQQRPDHYHIQVEGSGARGVLRGEGDVRLEASDSSTTRLHYSGQAQLGGTIASVGARVAQGAAALLLKQYFVRLADALRDSALNTRPAEPVSAPANSAMSAMTASIPTHPQADARHAIANGHIPVTSEDQRGPLMQLARRSGLSDGSIESERHIARVMIGGIAGALALVALGAALALGLAERGRNASSDD